jgi:hypothetical protein
MKHLNRLVSIVTACFMIAATVEATAADHNKNDGSDKKQTEMSPMQQMHQNQGQILKDSAKMLDSMVGHFKGKTTIGGVEHSAELTVEPKILDNYYTGRYTLKASSGDIVNDAFTVFSFNPGAMSYLFFFFDHQGFTRNYVGMYRENDILLHSSYRGGLGFTRWTVEDEDTIKKEDWGPQPGQGREPEGDPDVTILFNRVQ